MSVRRRMPKESSRSSDPAAYIGHALRLLSVVILTASLSASTSRFEDALALRKQGKTKEARDLLRTAASDFSDRRDWGNQAKALSLASQISVSLGDYRLAIADAAAALEIRRSLKGDIALAE